MSRSIPSSAMTKTMKQSAKRVRGSRKITEIIAWDRKLGTTRVERANLASSISTAQNIDLQEHLMTTLATKYKINTAAKTPFAELMKTLKEKNIALDSETAQREFAKVFLGPNPSRTQLEELKKIILDYKAQIELQKELKRKTSGIKNISATVDSSGKVSVKEKKGFWKTLFG